MDLLFLKQGINKILCQRLIRMKRKKKYKGVSCSIISSNCAGGVIYHDYGMKFQSPTINLFFENEDFLNFCENLFNIENKELLEFDSGENYPVGIIETIKIHFLHYDNFEDAKKKWIKRMQRLDKENIVLLFIEREKLSDIQFKRWNKLKYRKILVSPYRKGENIIFIPQDILDKFFHFRGISGHRYYEQYLEIDTLIGIEK